MSSVVARVKCPDHDDSTPSLMIYADGGAHCFGCGSHKRNYAVPQPEKEVNESQGGYLPWSLVYAYQDILHKEFKSRVRWLYDRGLSGSTVRQFYLGHTGCAYTIPNWDRGGRLLSIKFRRDEYLDPDSPRKYWGLKGFNQVRLYPGWKDVEKRDVLLCEGELDVIRLTQCLMSYSRYLPMSITGGASSHPYELLEVLRTATTINILYDQDTAGREGAAKIREKLGRGHIVDWRHLGEAKDVTDALNLWGSCRLFECLL